MLVSPRILTPRKVAVKRLLTRMLRLIDVMLLIGGALLAAGFALAARSREFVACVHRASRQFEVDSA